MGGYECGVSFVGEDGEDIQEVWTTAVPHVGDVYMHDCMHPMKVVEVRWFPCEQVNRAATLNAVVVLRSASIGGE